MIDKIRKDLLEALVVLSASFEGEALTMLEADDPKRAREALASARAVQRAQGVVGRVLKKWQEDDAEES